MAYGEWIPLEDKSGFLNALRALRPDVTWSLCGMEYYLHHHGRPAEKRHKPYAKAERDGETVLLMSVDKLANALYFYAWMRGGGNNESEKEGGAVPKQLFLAMRDSDQTEGRGPQYPIAAFFSRADAELAAEGQGAMGSKGGVGSLLLFDGIHEYRAYDRSKARSAALAKLSAAERELLGLRDE